MRGRGDLVNEAGRDGDFLFYGHVVQRRGARRRGLAADVTMLVGNGYVPGHAEFALDLLRTTPQVRSLFERRVHQ